ncbi:MAG TPA: AI-2E family transporter [Kofleriaceae bacterium]|nr:AI-2E family transporter [Kofleriaceae bacterium]
MVEEIQGAAREARDRDGNRRMLAMVRWLLYLVFVVIGWVILKHLAPVLTPILAAAAIAYLLDPLVERLVESGLSRVAAVSILLVSFLSLVTIAFMILIPLIADDVARFIVDVPAIIDRAVTWGSDLLGYELDRSWREIMTEEQLSKLLQSAALPLFLAATAIVGGVFSFLGHLAELLLVPVFAFYFLADWNNIIARARNMIPPRHRVQVVEIVKEIDGVVAGWIRGQLTVTTILAILYAIAFKIIGLHLAITMGLLVGALTFIPFLGTIVGAGITAILVVADWQGPNQLIAVGGVFVVLHLLEAVVLTPKIVGHRVGLSEVAALFAVLAGGKLLGLAGVLLAVPIAASVAVLVRRLVRYYEGSGFFKDGAEGAWAVDAADVVGDPPPAASRKPDPADET